jgi:sugar phosphate isomerase/epimerase
LRHLNAAEVVYVHLNDAQAGLARDAQIDQIREQVGTTGVIPIQPFLAALRHVGYDGPLTVEPFSAAIKAMSPDAAAAATSAALDQVLAAAYIAKAARNERNPSTPFTSGSRWW